MKLIFKMQKIAHLFDFQFRTLCQELLRPSDLVFEKCFFRRQGEHRVRQPVQSTAAHPAFPAERIQRRHLRHIPFKHADQMERRLIVLNTRPEQIRQA